MMIRKLLFPSIVVCLFACDNGDEGFNANAQLQHDIAAIDNYLDENGITAYKDQSGIRFVIHDQGAGQLPPKFEQTVKVTSTGTVMETQQTFRQTVTTEKLLSTFDLPGVQLGLARITEGTSATIYIPSGLGYGNQVVSGVPANSNLVVDVDLLDITRSSTEEAQLTNDVQKIDAALAEDNIDPVKDPSGLRYVITQPGTGATPGLYDKVIFNYTIKKFETGAVVSTGVNQPSSEFDSRVIDYVPGLVVGLRKLSKDAKATFYIPSPLGLGSKGSGDGQIAPNTNLIYEIEFVG